MAPQQPRKPMTTSRTPIAISRYPTLSTWLSSGGAFWIFPMKLRTEPLSTFTQIPTPRMAAPANWRDNLLIFVTVTGTVLCSSTGTQGKTKDSLSCRKDVLILKKLVSKCQHFASKMKSHYGLFVIKHWRSWLTKMMPLKITIMVLRNPKHPIFAADTAAYCLGE